MAILNDDYQQMLLKQQAQQQAQQQQLYRQMQAQQQAQLRQQEQQMQRQQQAQQRAQNNAAQTGTPDQPQLRQQQFQDALAYKGQAAPAYAGTFEDQLADLYDRIQNREAFSYDVNADPLYQNYKDQYIQGGKLAMKDTMGQAAALTGGYGSSYGQQVGQQAYDAYLQNLTDVIPELYGMAYDMYRDKGQDMLTQYGLLGQQRDTEYNRYRDELSDWNYNQDVLRQLEESEYNRRINEEATAWAREQQEYANRINEENTAYSRQQQEFANLVALIKASGYVPTDDELMAAGLTREAAAALRAEYLRLITPAKSGSSGGGGGGGGGSKKSGTEWITNQNAGGKATPEQVADAYSNAVNSGNIADANRLLTAAANLNILSVNKRDALENGIAAAMKKNSDNKSSTNKNTAIKRMTK